MSTEIALAEHLIPGVLNGSKQVTIRMGLRDYPLGPATVGGVPVVITAVRQIRLSDVPDEVMKSDGFANHADMLFKMREFYQDIHWHTPVTVVHFEREKK